MDELSKQVEAKVNRYISQFTSLPMPICMEDIYKGKGFRVLIGREMDEYTTIFPNPIYYRYFFQKGFDP